MILKQYNEDDEDKEESGSNEDGDSDEAPELITSRDDFDSMVNTFLNDYEILGRKMKPRMEGESGLDKLDSLRRAMGQDERVRIMNGENEEVDDEKFDAHLFPSDDDKKDRWDCETILSESTLISFLEFAEFFSFPKPPIRTLKTTRDLFVPVI